MKRAEKSLKELLRTGIQGEERGEDVLPELEDAVPAVPLTLGHRRVHKAQDKGHVAPKSKVFGGDFGTEAPEELQLDGHPQHVDAQQPRYGHLVLVGLQEVLAKTLGFSWICGSDDP